jgi:hypothetical protein
MHLALVDRWQRAASEDGFPWTREYFPALAYEFPSLLAREFISQPIDITEGFRSATTAGQFT